MFILHRVSAEKIFLLSPQIMKFGGTAGDSLSLGTKRWLSVVTACIVYGNIGTYLNLLCPVGLHTADTDATQLSS